MITAWLERLGERNLGLIGVVGTALAGVLIGVISFVPFGQSEYTANLRHTAGLRAGDEVQIAGIGVGEVRGLRLEGQHVVATFTVDSDVRLGRGTTAAVKVATLLGNHFLEVVPAGSGRLPDDRIPLDRTTVPFNLQDVLEGGTTSLNALDGEAITESLTVVAGALDMSPEQIRAAVGGVSRLSRIAAEQSEKMQALLASSRDVSALLAENSDQFIDLMKHSTVVIEELTRRRDVIHEMLIDARRLADSVNGILTDNEPDLDPLMRDFTIALDNLRKQEKQITASVDALATVSHYLANAGGNGPYLDLHVPTTLSDNQACIAGCD